MRRKQLTKWLFHVSLLYFTKGMLAKKKAKQIFYINKKNTTTTTKGKQIILNIETTMECTWKYEKEIKNKILS